MSLTLGPDDQDGIKSNPAFLTNTVIALLNGSAIDYFMNEVTEPMLYEVSGTIINDTISPTLEDFTLDLRRDILSLTFDEVVDTLSAQLSEIVIQNMQVTPTETYVLTASSTILSSHRRVVEVHLIGNDATAIKANSNLGTSVVNTFIAFNSSFISDFAGNPVNQVEGSTALQADEVINDTSRPRLIRFGINLSTSVLSLTFSETINISTFDPTYIQLSSQSNGTGEVFNLSGGNYQQEHLAVINITFTAMDNTFIKSRAQLGIFGSSITNTYISISANAAEDTSTNALRPINNTMPYPASYIIPDNKGPLVVGFTLDMNDGNLTIHFDEVVTIDSFNATTITLSGTKSAINGIYTLTTNSEPVLHISGRYVMVTLTNDDLNGIKGQEICNLTAECFISHKRGIASDELRNEADAREIANAIKASRVGTDFEHPTYVSYVQFDLDAGTMTLEFSETMYGASAQFTMFGLSASPGQPPELYLTEGEVVESITPDFEFRISENDLNLIKAENSLCTSTFNCVPQFAEGFLTDYAGNPVEAFILSMIVFDGTVFGLFIDDETGPQITSFVLNLNERELTLVFDETISFLQPIF